MRAEFTDHVDAPLVEDEDERVTTGIKGEMDEAVENSSHSILLLK
jgi:hypothetical protein